MENKQDMNRRTFLKRLGAGVAWAVALEGCTPKRTATPAGGTLPQGEIPTDRMTYRVNPKTGEKVSLLGYGCMRWPTLEDCKANE